MTLLDFVLAQPAADAPALADWLTRLYRADLISDPWPVIAAHLRRLGYAVTPTPRGRPMELVGTDAAGARVRVNEFATWWYNAGGTGMLGLDASVYSLRNLIDDLDKRPTP